MDTCSAHVVPLQALGDNVLLHITFLTLEEVRLSIEQIARIGAI